MSYGLRTINNSGIVSIDEDSTSYVYLGKTLIDVNQRNRQDITVRCNGYPLVFFGIPYGTVNGSDDNGASTWQGMTYRAAITMTRMRQSDTDPSLWVITILCNFVNGGNPGALYLRVFGLLHLNYPNGSGEHYGARLWNGQGQLTFDTGLRQLRLAGNSYDTEMVINSACPTETGRIDITDTSVALPFDLANKSMMANTRGQLAYPYYTGSYVDFETQHTVDQYETTYIDTGFWANGNILYARKFSTFSQRFDTENYIIPVSSAKSVFTRVAVIDNNLFP